MPIFPDGRASFKDARRRKYKKVLIDKDLPQCTKMVMQTSRYTVPQMFIGDTYVGGYNDLSELDRTEAD